MYTVIVADDEEEIRRALVRKIDWNSLGFELVGEASNGAEALDLTEKLGPDLLLTDIMMPFIGGIELARQVREVRPSTQIAFLTGYEVFEYAKKAIQYNIISYILKPISADEWEFELIKIRKIIDKKFEQFRSNNEAKEHLDTLSFVVPLLLDGFQHADSVNNRGSIISEASRQGLLEPGTEISYCVMVTRHMRQERIECDLQGDHQFLGPHPGQVHEARKLLHGRPRGYACTEREALSRSTCTSRLRISPERRQDHELQVIHRHKQDRRRHR